MSWADYVKTMKPEEEIFTFARTGNIQGLKQVLTSENINNQNHRGHSPLILACYHGHFETARFLLESGADIDLQDFTGNTALMGASFKGYLDIVKLLVGYGADPSLQNPQGLSSVGFAKFFGRSDVKEYLETIYQGF